MSNELDKFVLQYSVDMKDAVTRLEQLQAKVVKTNQVTNKGLQEFKEFGTGAANEIGKLIPGIDKVASSVGLMSAQFVAASAAIAVLAVGVKSVMALREQFGQQRIQGMDNGVSGLRMEEYQRKFVRTTGGNVSRDLAATEIGKFSEKLKAAYADPSRMGTEFRQLQMLGVDPGKRGQAPTGLNQAMTTLGSTFAKLKPEQVQGFAKTIGMNADFALALKELGPSIGTVTELTQDEITKRGQAEATLLKFNTELAKLNESFNNLEISLGIKLIPAFNELIKIVDKIVNLIPKAAAPAFNLAKGTVQTMRKKDANIFEKYDPRIAAISTLFHKAKTFFGPKDRPGESSVSTGTIHRDSQGKIVNQATAASQDKKTADKLLDGLDERNREGAKNAAGMQLAINMFAGAVATFANAVDERQAWAAWAGEVGRASLGGDGTEAAPTGLSMPRGLVNPYQTGSNPTYPENPATKYDKFFEAEAARNSGVKGMSVDLLKSIAREESRFNPNAKSGKGANGLMQVMQSSATPGANLADPATNIKEGAKIIADFLKMANGDVHKALTMYHGGTDPNNWGPLTRAYPGKVLGPQGAQSYPADTAQRNADTSGGESRSTMQLRQVQNSIEARLGIKPGQLAIGNVSSGDADWAAQQMKNGVKNGIIGIKKELSGYIPEQSKRAKLMQELRDQESGLRMLNMYSGQAVANAAPGERSITVGERAIIINVMDAHDPSVMGQVIEGHLQNTMGEILNNAADGRVY